MIEAIDRAADMCNQEGMSWDAIEEFGFPGGRQMIPNKSILVKASGGISLHKHSVGVKHSASAIGEDSRLRYLKDIFP